MPPKTRWNRIAEALATHSYDDAVDDLVEPVFGDFPPFCMLVPFFKTPGQRRLWKNKIEKRWLRWIKESNFSLTDQFFINQEISRAYHLTLEPKRKGKRRKYRRKA